MCAKFLDLAAMISKQIAPWSWENFPQKISDFALEFRDVPLSKMAESKMFGRCRGTVETLQIDHRLGRGNPPPSRNFWPTFLKTVRIGRRNPNVWHMAGVYFGQQGPKYSRCFLYFVFVVGVGWRHKALADPYKTYQMWCIIKYDKFVHTMKSS